MESQNETVEQGPEDKAEEERKRKVRDMLIRLREYRGLLPAGFKFDRAEANERR